MEARKFVMKNYLRGTPTVDDFQLITETLDPGSLKDGGKYRHRHTYFFYCIKF